MVLKVKDIDNHYCYSINRSQGLAVYFIRKGQPCVHMSCQIVAWYFIGMYNILFSQLEDFIFFWLARLFLKKYKKERTFLSGL